MGNWDLCGPSNGPDLHPLTLLKGAHLFVCLFIFLSLLVKGGIFLMGPTSIKNILANGQEEVL